MQSTIVVRNIADCRKEEDSYNLSVPPGLSSNVKRSVYMSWNKFRAVQIRRTVKWGIYGQPKLSWMIALLVVYAMRLALIWSHSAACQLTRRCCRCHGVCDTQGSKQIESQTLRPPWSEDIFWWSLCRSDWSSRLASTLWGQGSSSGSYLHDPLMIPDSTVNIKPFTFVKLVWKVQLRAFCGTLSASLPPWAICHSWHRIRKI